MAADRITDNSQYKHFQVIKLATGDLETFDGVVTKTNPIPTEDPRGS